MRLYGTVNTFFLFLVFFFSLLPVIATTAPANQSLSACDDRVGSLVSIQGKVERKPAGATFWESVGANTIYCQGDSIRVLRNSRAALLLNNDTVIRLDQNTTLTLKSQKDDRPLLLKLIQGVLYYFSIKPRSLELETPFVNGAVEGTEFIAIASQQQTQVSVFEGQVRAENSAGSTTISSGQTIIVQLNQKPMSVPLVGTIETMQWALYYPPLLDFGEYLLTDQQGNESQKTISEAVQFYYKNDLYNSLSTMEKQIGQVQDADFHKVKAALYLTAGRVDEADKEIKTLIDIAPNNAHGPAFQAVSALVRGDIAAAENLAKKAMAIDPTLPAALVAMSYVQQASFNLQQAKESIEMALQKSPDNGLLLSRYAELMQSLDSNSREVIKAGERAVEAAPHLARPQTVLGFAYLNRLEVELAAQSFHRAIELDQSAPLPRLGLGLVEIYNRNLAKGRDTLSIAAVLDPGNSLVRSYLGKAYYEEKDFIRAKRQFQIAKDLDPFDPTPHFYSAITNLKENQPGKALLDLRKSMELNDNRAIFRSRLMLDKDLASRAAGSGRVFNQLGFDQLALNYGRRSLEKTPSDYSSHRLLADSYGSMPRHEIARVSELLQSQLLQPLNIGPVQPQLAEPGLQILDGSGPTTLSFQEFNPLFQQNSIDLLFNGVAGSDDTFGNDLVAFGVYDKFSFSLGQYFYKTDGFRENNDQEQELYNAYIQYRFSPSTHLMAEFRSSDKENGDISVLFDPEQFNTGLRQQKDVQTLRVGGHHSFHPGSEVIATVVGQKHDENIYIEDMFGYLSQIENTDSISGELQHLFTGESIKTVIGGSYYDGDSYQSTELDGFPLLDPETVDYDHSALYGYGYLQLYPGLTLSTGLGYSEFDNGETETNDKISPKVGLLWKPLPTTSLRFAWIEGMTRTMISEQTIEPTQVAGFNQFYDDIPGTESEILGLGLDQEFLPSLYGGASFIQRNLDVPYRDIFSLSGEIEDKIVEWQEEITKIYLYWLPLESLSVAIEYSYENYDRSSDFSGDELFEELTTHKGKIKLAWFDPSGFKAELSTSYIDQQGTFVDLESFIPQTEEDSDNFWVTDASVGYLLPKGFGQISLDIKNLFDTDFNFQDTDPAKPTISHDRLILLRLTLKF